jgi:hypothetical protein
MPSPDPFQRNAEIRAAVAGILKWDPLPQDHALASIVLGAVLPTSPLEFELNQLSFMFAMVAPLEVGGKEVISGAAKSVANGARLNAQLASEAQLGELQAGRGIPIAGAGTNAPIRDVDRLVRTYGSDAADWAKVKLSE